MIVTANARAVFTFLAPTLVKAAVDGGLPRGIAIERLRDPAAEWS
jgi:site-specific DNA recombinase